MTLRPFKINDIDFIFNLFSRPETNRYSEYSDIKTRKEAEEMYEEYMKPGKRNQFRLLIENKTGISVGSVGLYNYSVTHRRAEIGYDLLREYWGNGIMSEVVEAVVRYGFDDLGLVRIEATVDSENFGSIRVLEKNMFKYEGTRRKRFYYRDAWHDEDMYAIINETKSST
jgi:ribosomal-protein-alanine N-acetyltransferase